MSYALQVGLCVASLFLVQPSVEAIATTAKKGTSSLASKGYKRKSSKQTAVGVHVVNGCGGGCAQRCPGPQGPQGSEGPEGQIGATGPQGPGVLPAFADAVYKAQANPAVISHDTVPLDCLGEFTDNILFCPTGNCFTVVEAGRYRIHFFIKVQTDDEITGVSLKINSSFQPIPSVNIVQSVSSGWFGSTTAYTLTGESIVSLPVAAQICLNLEYTSTNGASFVYKDADVPMSDPVYFSIQKIGNPSP